MENKRKSWIIGLSGLFTFIMMPIVPLDTWGIIVFFVSIPVLIIIALLLAILHYYLYKRLDDHFNRLAIFWFFLSVNIGASVLFYPHNNPTWSIF